MFQRLAVNLQAMFVRDLGDRTIMFADHQVRKRAPIIVQEPLAFIAALYDGSGQSRQPGPRIITAKLLEPIQHLGRPVCCADLNAIGQERTDAPLADHVGPGSVPIHLEIMFQIAAHGISVELVDFQSGCLRRRRVIGGAQQGITQADDLPVTRRRRPVERTVGLHPACQVDDLSGGTRFPRGGTEGIIIFLYRKCGLGFETVDDRFSRQLKSIQLDRCAAALCQHLRKWRRDDPRGRVVHIGAPRRRRLQRQPEISGGDGSEASRRGDLGDGKIGNLAPALPICAGHKLRLDRRPGKHGFRAERKECRGPDRHWLAIVQCDLGGTLGRAARNVQRAHQTGVKEGGRIDRLTRSIERLGQRQRAEILLHGEYGDVLAVLRRCLRSFAREGSHRIEYRHIEERPGGVRQRGQLAAEALAPRNRRRAPNKLLQPIFRTDPRPARFGPARRGRDTQFQPAPVGFARREAERFFPAGRHIRQAIGNNDGRLQIYIEILKTADTDLVHPVEIGLDTFNGDISVHPVPPHARPSGIGRILELAFDAGRCRLRGLGKNAARRAGYCQGKSANKALIDLQHPFPFSNQLAAALGSFQQHQQNGAQINCSAPLVKSEFYRGA